MCQRLTSFGINQARKGWKREVALCAFPILSETSEKYQYDIFFTFPIIQFCYVIWSLYFSLRYYFKWRLLQKLAFLVKMTIFSFIKVSNSQQQINCIICILEKKKCIKWAFCLKKKINKYLSKNVRCILPYQHKLNCNNIHKSYGNKIKNES